MVRVALERWFSGDVTTAAQWLERILHDPQPDTGCSVLQQACARVMRARLGLEPIRPAVAHAPAGASPTTELTAAAPPVVPILLCELAVTQNWTGDLAVAEENLAAAIRLSRTHDLPAPHRRRPVPPRVHRVHARSRGAAVEVAEEVLALVAERALRRAVLRRPGPARPPARPAQRAARCGATSPAPEDEPVDVPLHAADLTTRFWMRTRRSRLRARGGLGVRQLSWPSRSRSRRRRCPRTCAVALLLERAFLASLSGDGAAPRPSSRPSSPSSAQPAEAALVAGLRADLAGDRRAAVRHLDEVAPRSGHARSRRPRRWRWSPRPSSSMRSATASSRSSLLRGATVRGPRYARNAVPFLGLEPARHPGARS